MNLYKTMIDRQQKEVDTFLHQFAFFAFSKDQFAKGLERLGLKDGDEKKLCYLGFSGGYILKDHAADFAAMMARLNQERAAAVADPETGEQFALQMFRYELSNHEYVYTLDLYETIEALGYTPEEINDNPRLSEALFEAARQLREEAEE